MVKVVLVHPEQSDNERITMTRQEEYIKKFKEHFGYDEDFFPKESYLEAAHDLDDELKLKMPTDTLAREREGRAVILLVMSGDIEAEKVGKKLGDIMIDNPVDKTELLHAMEEAANKLYDLSDR